MGSNYLRSEGVARQSPAVLESAIMRVEDQLFRDGPYDAREPCASLGQGDCLSGTCRLGSGPCRAYGDRGAGRAARPLAETHAPSAPAGAAARHRIAAVIRRGGRRFSDLAPHRDRARRLRDRVRPPPVRPSRAWPAWRAPGAPPHRRRPAPVRRGLTSICAAAASPRQLTSTGSPTREHSRAYIALGASPAMTHFLVSLGGQTVSSFRIERQSSAREPPPIFRRTS